MDGMTLTTPDQFFAEPLDEEVPPEIPRHRGDDRPWIRHAHLAWDPNDYNLRGAKRGKYYSRASGVGKPIEDWWAVHDAQLDRAIYGVARQPELFYRAQGIGDWEAERDKIRAIRKEAIRAGGGLDAAGRGTLFHVLDEQRVAGGFDHSHLTADFAAGLDVMARLLEPFEVLGCEEFVVWDDEGIAGSLDRRLKILRPTPIERVDKKTGEITVLDTLEPGEVVVDDHKTGEDKKYHGATYAVQQLPYACGERYTHRDGRIGWPSGEAPSQRWALISHVSNVDPSVNGLYWVDLEAAKLRLQCVKLIKQLRKVDDLFYPDLNGPELDVAPPVLTVVPSPALAAIMAAAGRAELVAVMAGHAATADERETALARYYRFPEGS